MLFRFIKQIAAPTIFSKGIAQYKQERYEIAKPLLLKAGDWMPTLQTNPLFQAMLLLCDDHHDQDNPTEKFKLTLASLKASPHKDTDDYILLISDMEKRIARPKSSDAPNEPTVE